jgi:hypothetical protein
MNILIKKGYIVPYTTDCLRYDENDNYLGTAKKTFLKNLTITKSKYYTKDSLADDLRSGKI